jgi:hypothetical protein
MTARLIELSTAECESLLRVNSIGRLAIVERGFPIILPLHYETVDHPPGLRLCVHTRPGNVIDHPGMPVCFEIDGAELGSCAGWNVLVRGTLVSPARDGVPVSPDLGVEAHTEPLEIVPIEVSGRRLVDGRTRWTFDVRGYL